MRKLGKALCCADVRSAAPPSSPQVHAAIRADPMLKKKARKAPAEKKQWLEPKSTYEARKLRLKEKLEAMKDE